MKEYFSIVVSEEAASGAVKSGKAQFVELAREDIQAILDDTGTRAERLVSLPLERLLVVSGLCFEPYAGGGYHALCLSDGTLEDRVREVLTEVGIDYQCTE